MHREPPTAFRRLRYLSIGLHIGPYGSKYIRRKRRNNKSVQVESCDELLAVAHKWAAAMPSLEIICLWASLPLQIPVCACLCLKDGVYTQVSKQSGSWTEGEKMRVDMAEFLYPGMSSHICITVGGRTS